MDSLSRECAVSAKRFSFFMRHNLVSRETRMKRVGFAGVRSRLGVQPEYGLLSSRPLLQRSVLSYAPYFMHAIPTNIYPGLTNSFIFLCPTSRRESTLQNKKREVFSSRQTLIRALTDVRTYVRRRSRLFWPNRERPGWAARGTTSRPHNTPFLPRAWVSTGERAA